MPEYPKQIGGRITAETAQLVEKAERDFGVTEGALVRMALDDYMPRYIANQGKPQHAELFAQLATALEEKPELETELKQLARTSVRRRRVALAQ